MVLSSETAGAHYNDWPNAQGFDVKYEERSPVELKVEGHIPPYAAGVLFRTGAGARDVECENGNTYRVHHWFDSISQVHRFEIHPPEKEGERVRVTYNSRSCSDGLIAKIKKTGRRDGFTFGAKYEPCKSLFQKFQSLFTPRTVAEEPDELSVSVTLSVNFPGLSRTGERTTKPHERGSIQTLCNKTDNELFQMLDPETLEPIGIARQRTLHPELQGPLSATHAATDPETEDVYNYNLDLQKGKGLYRIFHVSASTAETSILATFISEPVYIHSFFLTATYVILCVWNSAYKFGGAAMLWNRNIIDSIAPYDSARRCKWYVVDKTPVENGGRGHVATYESDPFFAFHTVNAYEEVSSNGDTNIIADLVTYPDLSILKRFYIDNLMSNSATAAEFSKQHNCRPTLRRFTLPSIPPKTKPKAQLSSTNPQDPELQEPQELPPPQPLDAISTFSSPSHLSPELPTTSPAYTTKKHRFIYGILSTDKSTFHDSIVKFDVETQQATVWSEHGHTAGEPIFVADPQRSGEEDGGVLLSVMLDGVKGKSYLLVLDARDLSVVGKAHVDGVIALGFHGTFVGR